MNTGTAQLEVVDLGRRPYLEVLALQRALRLHRLDGTLSQDLLLLVEHEPVYTLGRGTKDSSLPVSPEQLRATGAEVVEIERGGDVTWHGPGQLVGYPIINLSAHREDLHWYLRTLEGAIITALAEFDLHGERVEGRTGVWVGGRKIASLGIHVKQWVTLHGFALNVHPDLGWFTRIVPCGIEGVAMTSVAAEHPGDAPPILWQRSRDAVVRSIAGAFGLDALSRGATSLPATR